MNALHRLWLALEESLGHVAEAERQRERAEGIAAQAHAEITRAKAASRLRPASIEIRKLEGAARRHQ